MQPDKKWLRSLPTTTRCNNCQSELNAPDWRFTMDGKDTIAMNFVKCHCGNMNIGAAGSTPKAAAKALEIWQSLVDELNGVSKH